MKEWNRIFIIYSVLMGALLVAGNMLLFTWEKKAPTGREYRVEINRLAGEIEEKQVENVSLLNCEYVVSIVKLEKEADVYTKSIDNYVPHYVDYARYRKNYIEIKANKAGAKAKQEYDEQGKIIREDFRHIPKELL